LTTALSWKSSSIPSSLLFCFAQVARGLNRFKHRLDILHNILKFIREKIKKTFTWIAFFQSRPPSSPPGPLLKNDVLKGTTQQTRTEKQFKERKELEKRITGMEITHNSIPFYKMEIHRISEFAENSLTFLQYQRNAEKHRFESERNNSDS
jgi:hypothetical protein